MRLAEAMDLSANKSATLIVRDPGDPAGFGTRGPKHIGTTYLWTKGHTTPMMIISVVKEMPDKPEPCICGDTHGFPPDQPELLYRVMLDDRWEPSFPVWKGRSALEALAYVAE